MKTFEVIYQAGKTRTGLTVQMDVYDAAKVKDVAQSLPMTEIGTTGRYYGSFTADGPNWHVQITDSRGDSAVKQFGPEVYDAAGVGTAIDVVAAGVAAVDAHLTAVEAKVNELGSPPMVG